jgi:peptidoglycan hydrolase-like protein with peptidoglycan-binding domain
MLIQMIKELSCDQNADYNLPYKYVWQGGCSLSSSTSPTMIWRRQAVDSRPQVTNRTAVKGHKAMGEIMNLVRCLVVSVCGALLCSCADLPSVPSSLRAPTCKNLPAGEEQLRAVQQVLVDQGYDPGPLDGQMGRKTREALRQFQSDKSLHVTGVADAATREALGFCGESANAASAVHPPTSNPQVLEAQRLLTERGYAPGPVDGLMGNKTREALNRFQSDNGLPVSGKADAQTLMALRSSVKPQPAAAPPLEIAPPVSPTSTPPSENTDDFALPQPASSMPAPSLEIAPSVPPVPTPPSPSVPPMPTPPSENTDDFALPQPASSMPAPSTSNP